MLAKLAPLAKKAAMTTTQPTPPQKIQPLSFSELLSLAMQLNARIDMLWQRVIYSHAAMVGVMVFFSSSDHVFVVPRLLVVFFYTMNALVTFLAFRDAYRGLRAAVADLAAFPNASGHVYSWVNAQNFDLHALRRAAILTVLWIIIAYLILSPLILENPLI